MREILFRGKRADNGEWVKGLPSGPISAIEFYDGLTDCETAEVISETVGQYTGLTDKNGTKIFEGDIVKFGDDYYEIAFIEKYSRFAPRKTGTVFAVFLLENSVIIGNIHDNPELLKGD
ncbi:MAG: YopX family protein [Bacteroides sp.]|nr:YopX family protein [Bacteroides sp.]